MDRFKCFDDREIMSQEDWKDIIEGKISRDDLQCSSSNYPDYPCDPVIIIPYQNQVEKTKAHCFIRETYIKAMLFKDRIYRWTRVNNITEVQYQNPYYKLPYPGLYIDEAGLNQLQDSRYWVFTIIPRREVYVGTGGINYVGAIHGQNIPIFTLKGISPEEFFENESIDLNNEIFQNPPEEIDADVNIQRQYVTTLRQSQEGEQLQNLLDDVVERNLYLTHDENSDISNEPNNDRELLNILDELKNNRINVSDFVERIRMIPNLESSNTQYHIIHFLDDNTALSVLERLNNMPIYYHLMPEATEKHKYGVYEWYLDKLENEDVEIENLISQQVHYLVENSLIPVLADRVNIPRDQYHRIIDKSIIILENMFYSMCEKGISDHIHNMIQIFNRLKQDGIIGDDKYIEIKEVGIRNSEEHMDIANEIRNEM